MTSLNRHFFFGNIKPLFLMNMYLISPKYSQHNIPSSSVLHPFLLLQSLIPHLPPASPNAKHLSGSSWGGQVKALLLLGHPKQMAVIPQPGVCRRACGHVGAYRCTRHVGSPSPWGFLALRRRGFGSEEGRVFMLIHISFSIATVQNFQSYAKTSSHVRLFHQC